MSLDVNTPRGKESVRQEEEMLSLLKSAIPSYDFIHTPKDTAADVDGFMVQNNAVSGMFLSSCRVASRSQMRKWGDTWLLTFEKIQKATQLAKQLCVPVYGFIYLVPDKLVLVIKLVSVRGEIVPTMRIERTETQATINGGKTVRSNAYIDLSTAKEFTEANGQ